ncbi:MULTISPECIES: hypothetical protein [Micromonospora]|uniref:hypothetical protein n=1 Tax=Micromonospora TaxID=1873 RepID=UPI00115F7CB4|nr:MULTISPECIES: hypothetical protein [Micromonospora]
METSSLFPDDVLLDAGNPLRRNLDGVFDRQDFSAHLVRSEFHRAMVVAHEQRHYLDYHLTNYGSWVSRFWGQVKQTVPALLGMSGSLIVPIHFMEDEVMTSFYEVPMPIPDSHQWLGVRLAANHARRVRRDHYSAKRAPHGFSGGAQLEALATTFEVGPAEWLLPMNEAIEVVASMPRNMVRWREEYVWLGDILAALDIGPPPVLLGEGGQAVNTRIWPPILVASLMGRFENLFASKLDEDPDLWHRIAPSSRLLDILKWLHERCSGKLRSVSDVWNAVNEACLDLYGEDVVSAMTADTQWMKRILDDFVGRANSSPPVDLLAHVRTRLLVAEEFAANPMPFIDPIVAWTQADSASTRLVPEYHFASRSGFRNIPVDLTPFDSMFYHPVAGKTFFVKPRTNAVVGEMQRVDEEFSAVARFLVRGAASPSWVGPEREAVARWLVAGKGIYVVPPFGDDLDVLLAP